MKPKWYLIENNSHQVFTFNSQKDLKRFTKSKGYHIKRSPTDDHGFYTESYVYVPAR
jgi:hypothetical protein